MFYLLLSNDYAYLLYFFRHPSPTSRLILSLRVVASEKRAASIGLSGASYNITVHITFFHNGVQRSDLIKSYCLDSGARVEGGEKVDASRAVELC